MGGEVSGCATRQRGRVRPPLAAAGTLTAPPGPCRMAPVGAGADVSAGSGGEAGRREILSTWAAAVAVILAARLLSLADPTGLLGANLGGVAALAFVWLADGRLRAAGRSWRQAGLPWWGAGDRRTWAAWGRGAGFALAVAAVLFPAFAAGWWGWAELSSRLPEGLARAVGPYALPPRLRPALPPRLALVAATQLLVVALPEEMFYRGWMQDAWARARPGRRVRVLGAELGAGFVATQALFALGHLVTLQPWRVATFFPGLLFGWARARTGGLAAPVVLHALSNLFLLALEASFLGPAR
jgi:membrane protease YdiL (CAAX protease family)